MLWHKHLIGLTVCCMLAYVACTLCQLLRDFSFVGAAQRGDIAAVSVYLRQGIKPDVIDAEGDTAMFLSVYRGNADMVRLLLSYGARPDGVLAMAVERGNADVLVLLVRAKPSAGRAERARAYEVATEMHRFDLLHILNTGTQFPTDSSDPSTTRDGHP